MLWGVVNLTPWWPLAWLAPIPLLLAAFHGSGGEARTLSLLAALIGLSSNFRYYQTTTGGWPIAVLLIALQALAWMGVVMFTRRIVRSAPVWYSVFAYPLLWAGLDTLINALSPHSSFGSLAYSQGDATRVIQIAALTGTPGIVFVVSLYASLTAVAIYRGRDIRLPVLAYGLPAVVILAALAFGNWRLLQRQETRRVAVGLAAVDDSIGPRVAAAQVNAVWASYESAISELAAHGARIVLLPEKIEVLNRVPAEQRLELLGAAARSTGVYLAAGTGLREEHATLNRFWLFAPSGELLTTYDKQHLVPGLEADMTPGKEFVTQEIAGVRYGLAICKDMHFPTLGRAYGRARVDAMLIPAWDFERDAWMAARMTALRGIESGYAVIRSSREGLLTVSDRFGRFAAERRSAPVPGAWLLTSAPLEHVEETLYAEWGDVFGWTCLALAVLMRLPVTGLMLAVRPLPRANGAEPASASLQD